MDAERLHQMLTEHHDLRSVLAMSPTERRRRVLTIDPNIDPDVDQPTIDGILRHWLSEEWREIEEAEAALI